jgi:DNA repair photolyase
MSANHLALRKCLKAWRKLNAKQKQKDRIRFYNRNILFRRKLRNVFQGWRAYTHECFKERMAQDTGEFRTQLEGRMLIQWKGRVDA